MILRRVMPTKADFLEGTTPAYEAYMQLKKSIAASLG